MIYAQVKKKKLISFYILFVKRAFNTYEIGIMEGAITLMLVHKEAYFDLKQKLNYFFMNLTQFEEIAHGLVTFCQGFNSRKSLMFHVLYHFALEAKVVLVEDFTFTCL